MASVWAISAVVGPTLGGMFVEVLDWRWIFFVNVPLALFAGWTLIRRFHEDVERVRHRIDITGAVLLTVGSSLLILGLLEGGVLWPWLSLASVVVLGGALLLLVGFALVERRASEPIIPGWVFRSRLLNTTNLVSLSVGAMLVGLTSYVPLYVQGVLGHNALVGGFAARGADHRLADRGRHRGPGLPADRLPLHRSDRLRRGSGRRRAARHPRRRLLRLAGGRDLLRGRPRHGLGRQPHPDRRAVRGRVAGPREWSPGRTCSPARWARPSASPSSAPSPTPR